MSTFHPASVVKNYYKLQSRTTHTFQTVAIGSGFLAVVKIHGVASIYQNTKNNGLAHYLIKSNAGPLVDYTNCFSQEEIMTALFMRFIETVCLLVRTEPDLASFTAAVKKDFPHAKIQNITVEQAHRGMNITPNCDFHEGDA